MDKDYSALFDNAYNLHINGKLDEAKAMYEELLGFDSSNLDVLNLYAQLNVSLKNYDKAIDIFNRIYSISPIEDILINLAKTYIFKQNFDIAINELLKISNDIKEKNELIAHCYIKMSDYKNAAEYYKKLIEKDKTNSSYYLNLSICFKNTNNIEMALKYAKIAYDIDNNDIDIILNISSLYELLKDFEHSIFYLLKVSEKTKNANIFLKIGILYLKLEKYNDSISYFEKVLDIEPDNKNAMLNIAHTYKYIDKANSISIYKEILELYPNDENILFNIYSLSFQILDFENALKYSLLLLEKDSKSSLYNSCVADSYFELYKYQDAIKYYELAIKYNPENYKLQSSLAYTYYCIREYDNALNIFRRLPQTHAVVRDYTILRLRMRDFDSVKEEFFDWHNEVKTPDMAEEKARTYFHKLNVGKRYNITEDEFAIFRRNLDKHPFQRIVEFQKKLLRNQDYSGKNVLIYNGHGAGDYIQFSRYFNILKEKVNHLIIEAPPALEDIMKYNFPDIEVINKSVHIPEEKYDYAGCEMCMLYYTGMNFYNIPDSKGYLKVPKEEIDKKSELDILKTDKKKIGIFWQGNPTTLMNRSIKLKLLEPLIDIYNTQLYSFQLTDVDFESAELKKKLPIIDLAPYINNYTDTAAFLMNLDVLVTIDTSIAHLAGALGVKTILLLPYDSEWRWFDEDEKTSWYDSVLLFRQKEPDNWQEVVSRVKCYLEELWG